jgi:hypothetical protein
MGLVRATEPEVIISLIFLMAVLIAAGDFACTLNSNMAGIISHPGFLIKNATLNLFEF